MKKIEKVIQINQTQIEYEAFDGTTFKDEVQCKKYENSAECVIRSRCLSHCVNTTLFGEDFIDLCNEGHVYGIYIDSKETLDHIIMFFNYYQNTTCVKKLTDDMIGKKIIIASNDENDYFWMYEYEKIINSFKSLFEEKSNE